LVRVRLEFREEGVAMRFIVPSVLLAVGVIHLLPFVGVLSALRLESLYGIRVTDPSVELLLRHRAVLFGLLGVFLTGAAFRPALYPAALAAGLASVVSFLLLAWSIGHVSTSLTTVVRVDLAAAVLLIVGVAAYAFGPQGQSGT
jgi:hypothetical protein